jgi:hypothetical protein
MVSAPVAGPAEVGENSTLIAHFAPTASPEPQSFVAEKAPVTAMFDMLKGIAPGLLTVTFLGEPVVLGG